MSLKYEPSSEPLHIGLATPESLHRYPPPYISTSFAFAPENKLVADFQGFVFNDQSRLETRKLAITFYLNSYIVEMDSAWNRGQVNVEIFRTVRSSCTRIIYEKVECVVGCEKGTTQNVFWTFAVKTRP